MNALKIFSQNWLDENCAITVLSGDATKAYLYDQNQARQWVSVGSSDAIEESLEIIFKNWQGSEVSRTFDRIILLNHNLKSCAFDYWDGAQWVIITPAALANVTVAYTYIELVTPISATRVRVRPATTQTANAEKAIGELKFCQKILPGTQLWLSALTRSDEQQSDSVYTGEGRLIFWKDWTRFAMSGNLVDVTLADHDLLFPYLKSAQFVTIVFYNDFDLTECFECAIVSSPGHTLDRKTKLFEISLELKER